LEKKVLLKIIIIKRNYYFISLSDGVLRGERGDMEEERDRGEKCLNTFLSEKGKGRNEKERERDRESKRENDGKTYNDR
jgi:hypothetical protein